MPKNIWCDLPEMINCNENENDNGKISHINKTSINLDVDTVINIQNLTCLGKSLSNA